MMGSYGRVSRYGLIAFASSLDRIGPFAKNVRRRRRNSANHRRPRSQRFHFDHRTVPTYTDEIGKPVKGLPHRHPAEYFAEGMDPGVRTKVEAGIEQLEKLGCETDQGSACRTPNTPSPLTTSSPPPKPVRTSRATTACATVSRIDDRHASGMYRKTRGAGFGAEVKRRIMLGTYVLSAGYYDAYYLKAQKVRALIAQDFRELFKKSTPSSRRPRRFPLSSSGEKTDDPLQMYLADIYTVTGSLAGIPGISVPCGKTPGRSSVGLQLFGPAFGESRILQLAHAFEQAGGANL